MLDLFLNLQCSNAGNFPLCHSVLAFKYQTLWVNLFCFSELGASSSIIFEDMYGGVL